MYRMSNRRLGIALVAAALALAPAAIAGSAPEGTPTASPPPQPGSNLSAGKPSQPGDQQVALLNVAYQLVEFGRKTKDPLALVEAAKIMKLVGGQPVARKPADAPAGAPAGAPAPAAGKPASAPPTPGSVLAEARSLAKGDKTILAMIAQAASASSRGAVGGPKASVTSVIAGHTDVYNTAFVGGLPAEVVIAGDGGSDLDLAVVDENGNLICSSSSPGDVEYCGWTPRWTGKFQIRVKNNGTVDNAYKLLTN